MTTDTVLLFTSEKTIEPRMFDIYEIFTFTSVYRYHGNNLEIVADHAQMTYEATRALSRGGA